MYLHRIVFKGKLDQDPENVELPAMTINSRLLDSPRRVERRLIYTRVSRPRFSEIRHFGNRGVEAVRSRR